MNEQDHIRPFRTLTEFYALMAATVPVRRAAAASLLEDGSVPAGTTDTLRRARDSLLSLPGHESRRDLEVEPGWSIASDVGDELSGLEADIAFLGSGHAALMDHLAGRRPGLIAEVHDLARTLDEACPGRWQALLTDRDGTIAGYCGRYRSSIQPAWNAVLLGHFAKNQASRAVLLTSAPLDGLLNLTTLPSGLFDFAGSKGRECLDRFGDRHTAPLEPGQQYLLNRLEDALKRLLDQPENKCFALIGSGFQVKLGQLTVARQDVLGSIPPKDSSRFLAQVRDLASEIAPADELDVLDTGLDIELMPVLPDTGHGFGKAEAVRFLDDALSLRLATGPVLACGDTEADLPMLAEVAARSPAPFAILVTQDRSLIARLPGICPAHAVVSSPEVLACALGLLSGRK